MKLRFEPLGEAHDRTGFTCGDTALDAWFRTRAGQDQRRDVTRVVLALDQVGIAGFYTLSMFSVELDAVPEEVARRLPKYPQLPAALVGRLARAQRLRGRGIGDRLVTDALERIVAASRSIAAFTIIVDAKDEAAASFYRRFGFMDLPKRGNRLFMLTETAARGLRAAGPR